MQLPELILDIGTNYYEVSDWMNVAPIQAAKEMIRQAHLAGADAVKFQFYKADKFVRKDAEAFWRKDKTQYEVFNKQDLFGMDEYIELEDFCSSVGIEFLCTAFDLENLNLINRLVKRHKVASADITFTPYLEQIASYGKPVILSTGASTFEEIENALCILKPQKITLLHCVLKYPNTESYANLGRIKSLNNLNTDQIGYSDHCIFNADLLCAAWLLGAKVIEKHFTLSHLLKENDHEHACDVSQFRQLKEKMLWYQSIINNEVDQDDIKLLARRGVYAARDIAKGTTIDKEDVEFLRPQGIGISPEFIHLWSETIENLKANRDYKQGEQIVWDEDQQ